MPEIEITKIKLDAGTQMRVQTDEQTVEVYAQTMKQIAEDKTLEPFPPIVIFDDGIDLILADGFHRIFAAMRAGLKTITAEIRKGTLSDAVEYALKANNKNGLRRTVADKRNSVEVALRYFGEHSDRFVAELCGVSAPFVGRIRASVKTVYTMPEIRIGKDGVQQPARKPKVKATPAPKPEMQSAPVQSELDREHVPSNEPEGNPVPEALQSEPPQAPESIKPEVKSQTGEPTCPCEGMIYANVAILALGKIRYDDQERTVAGHEVVRWVREHILIAR